MKNLSLLIKPASSKCNLSCKYCFYTDVANSRRDFEYDSMTENTMKKLIDNAFNSVDSDGQITFAFQGGEPMLAGIEFFYSFIENVNKIKSNVKVYYSLQTNGLLIDDSWCDLFKDNNFLIGLSIDGNMLFHDANRVDKNHYGSFERVINAKQLLDKNKIEYNVLTVLTKELSMNPNSYFAFLKQYRIKYSQIIPCLEHLDGSKHGAEVNPILFFNFYKELLKIWVEYLKHGEYYSIKLFDDIVNFILHGRIGFCGMNGFCNNQKVVESNGDIFPCDFYCIDKYRMGNIENLNINDTNYSRQYIDFSTPEKLSSICLTCNLLYICNGGCKRLKNRMYLDIDENFCGFREVFNVIYRNIDIISNYLDDIFFDANNQ